MFGQNQKDFLTGIEATAQNIQTRLLLLQAEWWEDLEDGLPLWQQILGYRDSKNTADILIRDRILGTRDVTDITEFESTFNPNTRKYTFSATVNTTYGIVDLKEVTV